MCPNIFAREMPSALHAGSIPPTVLIANANQSVFCFFEMKAQSREKEEEVKASVKPTWIVGVGHLNSPW
jgi:hypothetical protein